MAMANDDTDAPALTSSAPPVSPAPPVPSQFPIDDRTAVPSESFSDDVNQNHEEPETAPPASPMHPLPSSQPDKNPILCHSKCNSHAPMHLDVYHTLEKSYYVPPVISMISFLHKFTIFLHKKINFS